MGYIKTKSDKNVIDSHKLKSLIWNALAKYEDKLEFPTGDIKYTAYELVGSDIYYRGSSNDFYKIRSLLCHDSIGVIFTEDNKYIIIVNGQLISNYI